MKTKDTNHLIADVLALSLEVRKHLEDRRRRLTTQQVEGLSNAVSTLSNYFAVWKAHQMAAGRTIGRRSKRVVLTRPGTKTRRTR